MPSDFPGSPKLQKGALVIFVKTYAPTNIISFQYNPETMSRTLKPVGSASSTGTRDYCLGAGDTQHVPGPPGETFSLSVQLDAADQLEVREAVAVEIGLHPALAALELLL